MSHPDDETIAIPKTALLALAKLVAPIVAELVHRDVKPAEVSSIRLPADCKSADAFNRACRNGRVRGARKVGRVWVCTIDDWRLRSRGAPPRGLAERQRVIPIRATEAAVLEELGLAGGDR